jgi:thiosulfate/3-mercaptopyruvate sulfurtransferase
MVTTSPLISVEEVAASISSGEALTLLDVRWNLGAATGGTEYLAGHLPGAVWVDLDADLADPPGVRGRHPLPDPVRFGRAMRRAGVRTDRPVVAYDGANGMAAARLWWLLTDGGKSDVRVLDGGFAAWVREGRPVEIGEVIAEPGDVDLVPGHRPVVDVTELQHHLAAGRDLWDVRAAERYRGESESVDRVAGHIPGARNVPVGQFTGPDGFAPRADLIRAFENVAPGAVMSCGSGVTAAAGILAAESAGITGLALYPGSWSEWIADPTRPIQVGPEPRAAT